MMFKAVQEIFLFFSDWANACSNKFRKIQNHYKSWTKMPIGKLVLLINYKIILTHSYLNIIIWFKINTVNSIKEYKLMWPLSFRMYTYIIGIKYILVHASGYFVMKLWQRGTKIVDTWNWLFCLKLKKMFHG